MTKTWPIRRIILSICFQEENQAAAQEAACPKSISHSLSVLSIVTKISRRKNPRPQVYVFNSSDGWRSCRDGRPRSTHQDVPNCQKEQIGSRPGSLVSHEKYHLGSQACQEPAVPQVLSRWRAEKRNNIPPAKQTTTHATRRSSGKLSPAPRRYGRFPVGVSQSNGGKRGFLEHVS
jgi:hypothetical protein